MNIRTVDTKALKYAERVQIVFDEYESGSLYIGLYTMDGELYTDITTNLAGSTREFAFVETGSEAERFISEQGFAEKTDLVKRSGFNGYRLYHFAV